MKHTKITVQINVSHYFNDVFSYLNSVGFFYLKTYKTFKKNSKYIFVYKNGNSKDIKLVLKEKICFTQR